VRHAALNVAATASFGSVVINGNPLMRFDGYYMLSDWLELPNLSASGQKFMAGIFQRLLGIEVPPDNRSPKAKRIIAIYAISAMFWRILVYTGLLLMLYAMVLKLGAFLAGIAVFLALTAMLIMPAQRIVKYLLNQPALSRQRLAIVGGCGLFCIFLLAFILTRPSTVRAWGIVEYSPPTIVRLISPGFVREVKVRDGQKVASGDVLVVMENDELQQQLADLRVDVEQSVLQERMLRQNQENAKAQAEMAKCRSLKQKEAEIVRLVEGLTVRAPSEGKVVAHDLDSMVGRYLSAGDEIVVIGNEESKEVVVAAAQDDINSFTSQLYMPVTVRVSGDESNAFTASLGRVDPRASLRIPHPALGADAGGALPVKPKKQKADAKAPDSELLDPHFSASISLFSTQSLRLHAGQRAMVLFSSSEQSWAGRLVLRLRKWIDDRLASTQQAS
jgi:putative peptide zinc metalloprotease protein